jgi:hypothetical protein
LSKRWNVARLTSEISSSSRVGTRNGAAFCQTKSATEPAVAGISAGDPPVDATQDTPAIPSTDIALFGRFPFAGRFACGIAEFLLYLPSNKRTTSFVHHFVRFELHHVRPCISELERPVRNRRTSPQPSRVALPSFVDQIASRFTTLLNAVRRPEVPVPNSDTLKRTRRSGRSLPQN